MFLIWDQTLAFAFLLYHLRRLVKNWTSYFITGSKHLETNESSRPIASCFHLSLGVWNPWWRTCPRSWHTTSNTVWLQTSQRFSFFFLFIFYFFLDRWQVKVHVSVKFPAEVDSLWMYIFKRFDADCKIYHSLAHPKKVSRLQENIFGGLKKKTLWSCVNVLSRNQNVWWSQNVWSRTRLKFLIVQIWYFAILPHPADAASLIFSPSSCSTLVLQKIFCSPAVRWRIFSIFPALSGNNYQQFCRRKTYLSKKTRRFL